MVSLPRYENYKDSGVEWLGEIPEHWGTKKLKYVSSFITTGKTPKSSNEHYFNGEIDWFTPSDFKASLYLNNSNKTITKLALLKEKLKLYPPYTILLIGIGATIGKTGIIFKEAFSNQQINAINLDSKNIFPKYGMYYIASKEKTIKEIANSVTLPIFNQSDTKNLIICVPSIAEQKRIAGFLDRKCGEIDEAIAKKQRLIELLEEQKTILINQAVTKGLNPDAPMKDSGIEWLGEIPKHWKSIVVKKAAKVGYKNFVDGDWIESPFIKNEGIRLIQTGNVGIGVYKEKGYRYISEKTFTNFNCTEIFPDNILICRLDGPVGRACLVPDLGVRMITSVDNAILKPSKDFDPQFIVYVMSSSLWIEWIQSLCRAGGGFRFRISRSMLGELRIPMPPINEQIEISHYLNKQIELITKNTNILLQGIEKLTELKQILIAEAVTGKIKV